MNMLLSSTVFHRSPCFFSHQPLFLYFAHQAVHSGNDPEHALQAPKEYYDRFSNITDDKRRMFAGKYGSGINFGCLTTAASTFVASTLAASTSAASTNYLASST